MLSSLMLNICDPVGMKKINTASYHPQADGLVEKMNRTLHVMIGKHAHRFGPQWDFTFNYSFLPTRSSRKSPLGKFRFTSYMEGMCDCPLRLF